MIAHLGTELERAARDHDWPRLQSVDTRVMQLLISLRFESLSPDKIQALKRLQTSHMQAFDYCQQQSKALEEKMSLNRNNRDGLSAYATMAETTYQGTDYEGSDYKDIAK